MKKSRKFLLFLSSIILSIGGLASCGDTPSVANDEILDIFEKY